jgi:hypothetical protein
VILRPFGRAPTLNFVWGGGFPAVSPIPNLKIDEIYRNMADFTKIVEI